MWDEKKFFDDYVNESEKIKPDDDFVEQLKKMAVQEEKKKKPIPMIKYAAIAASFLICAGLGNVVWNNLKSEPEENNVKYHVGVEAGKHPEKEQEEKETEEKEPEKSGEQLEKDGLTAALDSIKQGMAVRDQDGNEISQSQQQELWNLLKDAKETEEPENLAKEAVYFLEGEKTLEVEVWQNGYLHIEGRWYY